MYVSINSWEHLPSWLPAWLPVRLSACLLAGKPGYTAAAASHLAWLPLLLVDADQPGFTHREDHLLCGLIKAYTVAETSFPLSVI
jgi:hypothetical protein